MTNGSDDFEYERQRREEQEAERVRQQRIRDRAPGRRANGRARPGDIDAVLDQVKEDWEFVCDPDFNNVDLALELLDESSVGKDIRAFRRTKDLLSKALKGSVDKHYQAFAAALPHHSSLVTHLSATQTQISDTRSSLQEAKDSLGNKRADLVQLWGRGQILEEMMRLLDQIEHLKSVPDLLETLMSEKRLLQASVLLVRSLKIINKQDMLEIGAVADLRSYLSSQEVALRDILVDELQSHLYLKSFWCDSRWSSYVPGQQSFPKVEYDESLPAAVEDTNSPTSPTTRISRKTRLHRFLHQLAIKPNDPPDDPNDLSAAGLTSDGLAKGNSVSAITHLASSTRNQDSNPETDSFAYMETLLESLAVLGKLGSALDVVGQRVQGEVFSLVETTLDEVSDRAEYGRRGESLAAGPTRVDAVYTFAAPAGGVGGPGGAPGVVLKGGLVNAAHLRLAALESASKQVDHDTLRDFFWTLYSKLDAVSQGMRVVYEVANRIGSRRDFKDSSGAKPGTLFHLGEAWTSIQAEIRTLLHEYLTDEEQGAASGRNPISSINEMLRDSKFNTRDKSKSIFRFADVDYKLTNKMLKVHEDELTRVLKDTVPGLVQGSESTVHAALSILGADDRVLGAGASQHHRLLIRPDAFHVSVLFQPTLSYLERVQDNLPAGNELARSLSTVLDDFVLKVYLPQLEEKVSELFSHAVNGPDAFQPDPASARLCSEPLIKSSTQLMALINSLCVMLQTTPFHRENYSRLILGVIIQFYQRCSDWFQGLVSTAGSDGEAPHVALAAQWAQRNEMSTCLTELQTTSDSLATKQQQLCRQQVNVELEWCDKEITAKDLISSTRTVASLASLYRSVAWFASQLGSWNTTSEDEMSSPVLPTAEPPLSAVSMSLPTLPPPAEGLHLPLSKEMNMRFNALLKTYEQLSELILHTIRVDIHCRTIYHLESALRSGNYHIEHEASEPDPHVNELNTEMGEIDDFVSMALPKHERQFIFVGLGHLMEHVIISKASLIRQPTPFGIKKMLRNMLALRQGIKTIANDPYNTEFERAKKYFALYFLSPQRMLESIRQRPVFTFDEYETMLKFQCGLDSTDGKADRNFSMFVIELHGLELERSS